MAPRRFDLARSFATDWDIESRCPPRTEVRLQGGLFVPRSRKIACRLQRHHFSLRLPHHCCGELDLYREAPFRVSDSFAENRYRVSRLNGAQDSWVI